MTVPGNSPVVTFRIVFRTGAAADPANMPGLADLTATRNVCLTCHNDKVTHKAGGECAKCHQVVWTPMATRAGPR